MELFYRKFGKGQPLIILHGLFGSSDNWMTIGKELSDNNEVFMPDLRNHGRSPHYSHMNYFSMSSDIVDFIRQHNIEDPIILGHSMGGKVAMQTALENNNLVKKLIIVDIGIKKYPESKIAFFDILRNLNFDELLSRKEIEFVLKTKIADFNIVNLILKNIERKNNRTLGWRINFEAIDNNITHILSPISSDTTYTQPTLIVKGALSDYILDEDRQGVKELFPTAIFSEINNAGHWVHVDNKDYFLKEVRSFLR